MATNDELNELRERIGRLGTGDQVWLLETVLADNRRRWEEEVVRQRAATIAFLEREKQHNAATAGHSPETKREAG